MDEPRKQVACINYLDWQDLYRDEKPYQVFAEVEDGDSQRLSNLVFAKSPPVTIRDLRGREEQFSLDQNGFMVRQHQIPAPPRSSAEEFRANFLPLLEEIVKAEVEGADLVHCFDWGFRSNGTLPPQQSQRMNVNDKMHLLTPGRQVHCDQSPAGALNRLTEHLPDVAERAATGRVRIINLWTPLHHVVVDNTLAVCDGQTIKDSHLVEADHISRTYLGSTMYGLYSPDHQWYYLHHQMPGEILFFKIFDSSPDAPAKCSLHVSFDYNDVPEGAPPRESMEVRFLVVTFPD